MLSTLLRLFSQSTLDYHLAGTLRGHKSAVNVIKFNPTCTLMATGGDDETVRTWDVQKNKCIQTISDSMLLWGQITALSFVNLERCGFRRDALVFGTGRGTLVMYHRTSRSESYNELNQTGVFEWGDSVESFDFDPTTRRVIVASHYGKVKMFKFDNNQMEMTWVDASNKCIPRAVIFAGRGATVWIYLLEIGAMICRDADTGTFKSSHQLKTPIGSIDICPSTGNMVVDNLKTGFDLYLKGKATKKSVSIPSKELFVRGLSFAEDGSIFVAGSDHGLVYIFDVTGSRPRKIIKHGRNDQIIQSLIAASNRDDHFIATTASNKSHEIKIWKKPTSKNRKGASSMWRIADLFVVIILMWLVQNWWLPPVQSFYQGTILPKTLEFIQSRVPNDAAFDSTQRDPPTLNDVIDALDTDTLRRILNIGPPLTEEELQEHSREARKDLVVI